MEASIYLRHIKPGEVGLRLHGSKALVIFGDWDSDTRVVLEGTLDELEVILAAALADVTASKAGIYHGEPFRDADDAMAWREHEDITRADEDPTHQE